ncbi:MAG: ribonuclease P protein component [Emcibacter sp.]|nr:ribonuclease P protein component [Emcibacter sp.]
MTQTSEKNKQNNKLEIPVLRKRQDFLRVAAAQKKWVSKNIIVQKANRQDPNTDTEDRACFRIGYTASKKVGNAVKRNRAKRRLREVVRASMGQIAEAGCDYVIIARSECVDVPFDQLIRDFGWCIRRLKEQNSQNKPSNTVLKSPIKPDTSTSLQVKK